MKAKYIFASLVAALALVVGCEKEVPHYLSEVTVDTSFATIPLTGGTATVKINASSPWTVSGMPSWLTVSPTSGSAGESTVTLSAESALDGRTSSFQISCGDQTQTINVTQGVPTVSPATCAEIIAGPDSKTYRVTGVVTNIVNTQYGNWYLQDATGEIYIYGTLDAKGAEKNFLSLGLEVGDEVTVEGPKTTYNGTVELVNVTVVKINKSLIKVAEMNPEDGTIPSDGGEVAITLENKGDGIFVEVPEAAQSWLSIASLSGNTVVFRATENMAGPRNATLVFKTTDGKKEYSAEASVMQLGASGSKALPFKVTEAVEYMLGLGVETTKDFYVKGIISKIEVDKNGNSQEFGSYGNATFWISEDGEFHDDKSLDFEAFRVLWLGNEKWVEGNAQIEVGAEVVLCGKFTVYNGTAETAGNKAWIDQINGVSSEAEGIGTLNAPFTAVGGVNAAAAGTAANVYVKGIISQIVKNGEFGAQYGNASFWMSKDGKFNDDKSMDFEAYRVLYMGNRKWVEGDTQIAVGDEVVIYGPLTTFNGTSETVGNKAYIYSLNGKTE